MSEVEAMARVELETAFGAGPDAIAVGSAPGRCTLAGEHVDYADGAVLAVAVDRVVAVAARRSRDGAWRIAAGGRAVETGELGCHGSAPADRAAAVAMVLREHGVVVAPVELAIAASLPEAAGLSSSAALSCAVAVALLRLSGTRIAATTLIAVALRAERDLVGVPCGPLDQRAVVLAPDGGALLIDCAPGGGDEAIPWNLGDVVLAVCHTGETHDIGGAGYRARRVEAAAALRLLGTASFRDLDAATVAAAPLPPPLNARARHIVGETGRALAAAAALRAGDAAGLGRLMTESGRSLRDDYAVTTAALDACVDAALTIPGCLGARMVGGGFGGSVVALVDAAAAPACLAAMERAVAGGEGERRGAWLLHPAGGVAVRAPDVVA